MIFDTHEMLKIFRCEIWDQYFMNMNYLQSGFVVSLKKNRVGHCVLLLMVYEIVLVPWITSVIWEQAYSK